MRWISLFALIGLIFACEKDTPKGAADQALSKTSSAVQALSSASMDLQNHLSAAEEGCKMDAPCGESSSSQP